MAKEQIKVGDISNVSGGVNIAVETIDFVERFIPKS